jgi:hypothetical protein
MAPERSCSPAPTAISGSVQKSTGKSCASLWLPICRWEEIMKRAKADLEQTQTAIYETALPLYKKYFPNADQQTLTDKHKVTAAVLDKLAEQHPNDGTVVDYAKKVVTEATGFRKTTRGGQRSEHAIGCDRDAGIQNVASLLRTAMRGST